MPTTYTDKTDIARTLENITRKSDLQVALVDTNLNIFSGNSGMEYGWAIPSFGQLYYTQYYTSQKYAKLYNTLYQYYTKSKHLLSSVNQHQAAIFESNLIIK